MEHQEANQLTNEEPQPSLFASAARSGLILGVISIIIALVIYLIDGTLLANFWVGIGILVLLLVLVIRFGISYRKEVGNVLTFGKAFLYCFVVLAVAGFIGQIFNYLLFNVIDPELVDVVTRASIDNTMALMERFGADQDAIDEAIAATEEQMANQYTIGGIIKQYLWGWIFYAIVSLIGGAIVKKRSPEEEI